MLVLSKTERIRSNISRNTPRDAKALLAIASASWVAMLAGLAVAGAVSAVGCSASTRTRVQGAETGATHRVESAGVERTRTIKLRITPPAERTNTIEPKRGPAVTPAARPTTGRPGEPVISSVAFTPDTRVADTRVSDTGPALLPASWPGGSQDRSDADPIADAIADAARQGRVVEYEATETETVPLTASESTLSDAGASLDTASPEAALAFESRKGGVTMPFGGRSRGSSGGLDADLSSAATNPLVWIGGLVCVGAIVPLVLPPRRIGLAVGVFAVGAGIATLGIVATNSPWVFALAVIVAAVVAALAGYQAWRNGRAQLALRTVAQGVQDTPPQEREAVKARIANAAPAGLLKAVRREVSAQKDKLPSSATSG